MPIFQGYIAYAPFPEGFQGDMDETFQQSGQLALIYVNGNFLTGLYYPVGTIPPPTLPTGDQGPIALNGQWYFWDPVTGQYLPQSASVKQARNYAKNAIYQVQQLGNAFSSLPAGVNRTYDMVISRVTQPSILSIALDVGPTASADTDYIGSAIKYTVGTTLVPSLAATDLFAHEHLIEGNDIAGIQGETLSLSFSVWVNQPGNYSAYLTSNGRDASYVFPFTIATPNSYARIKINNIPALPTGTGTWNFGEGQTGLYLGVVMGVGAQYQTATPNQWVSGFFAGTAANSNMLSVTTNQIKVTAIKLESSPSSTYFTANSFETDYHDAIRYYFTNFNYQSVTGGFPIAATAHAANSAIFNFQFPRRMCKVPTVVPYGWTSNTQGKITNISTGVDYTMASIGAVNKGVVGASSGLTAVKGEVILAFITADARLS
jgi:hypothetical protein